MIKKLYSLDAIQNVLLAVTLVVKLVAPAANEPNFRVTYLTCNSGSTSNIVSPLLMSVINHEPPALYTIYNQ